MFYEKSGFAARVAWNRRGRFQYTGQIWLPELGMYHYKARTYSPTLGRFMQTDPIGYGDGMNWYNYVGGDPVNNTDPSGMKCINSNGDSDNGYCDLENPAQDGPEIVQYGPRRGGDFIYNFQRGSDFRALPGNLNGNGSLPSGFLQPLPQNDDIVVTAKKAAKKVGQCIAAQYGFGDGTVSAGLSIGKIASELGGIPLYKPWVGVPLAGGRGVSRFTNPISYIPFRLGIRANTGSQILGSGRVFGVLGRLNAPVAAALFAYDAVSIAVCSASD